MKKNRIATLFVLAFLALAATACNNPLLAATTAEGASDVAAEIEAQVQAALAQAEASGELSFIADEGAAQPAIEEEVQVEDAGDALAEPEQTPEVEPAATAEPTPVIEACTNRAAFVADVTVPDGTDFAPDQDFTKTWRLRNAGTCTWTSSYALVFDHGDAMGSSASQALSGLVNPGQMVDLSVDLTAPSSVGGYKGYWRLRNGEGVLFGIGSDASVAFWAEIEVLEVEDEGDDFVIMEFAPIPMFPIFASHGNGQMLSNGACFDLDAGSLVGCGNPAADFRFNAELNFVGFPPVPWMAYEIQPRNGAGFAEFGGSAPTGAECQAMALGGGDLDAKHNYTCYRTSNAKYGFLKTTVTDMLGLTFDWGTYTFP